MASIRFAVVLAIIMVVLALSADAAYRKPPFNGSIFGKRSSTATDYEILIDAFSTICEATTATCTAWLSRISESD